MVMSVKITNNVFWKYSEKLLTKIVSVVVSIILARKLLPDDYGIVAIVTVFIAIGETLISSGLPSALIQKKDVDDTELSSVFYFNFALSLLIYLVLFLCAPLISNFYGKEVLCSIIRVFGISIILSSINSTQYAYASRNMMFKTFFWASLFGTFLSCVIGVVMAYNGCGVWSLVVQTLSDNVIDTVFLWFTIKWRPKLLFSWSKLKLLIKFGWKIIFEGLSQTIYVQLQSVVIGKVYTSSDLAYYSKGQNFPELIVNNICSSVASVLYPVMSAEQEDKLIVKALLRKTVRITSYMIFPMLTGLVITAAPFVSVLLTDKWLDCVPYLQIFCFTQAATVGLIPRHQALNATGRSDIFMNEHILYRVVSIFIFIFVYKISVMAIALSAVAGSIIMVLTVAFTSKRYNGYSYKEQILDILPIIIGCIVMGVPTYFIQLLHFGNVLTLLLQVVTGVVLYVVYSIVFKLLEFSYIVGWIKQLLYKFRRRKNGVE